MDVVIVESPAKAKTINKYLGRDYRVLASFGHVRDLPSKDGSVRPDDDFAMTWEVDPRSAKRLKEIAEAVKGAKHLYLATDPDREGEAISWHVRDVLAAKRVLKDVSVKRVVFNEITKRAVTAGIARPREIDQQLVDAYFARRALDYLVGFTLSPVLWRKLPGARSAGRVQSVALRLICDRELEIERFETREYWTVEGRFEAAPGTPFAARLVALDGRKLDKFDLKSESEAAAAVAAVRERRFHVEKLERKPTKRHPQPPFTTSTLQQEAARKLGFSAARTMRLAQTLYEGKTIDGETTGLITYMRTDGVSIAEEAVAAARAVIGERYGAAYLPAAPRRYKSKAKNAQEAHEAIRPTDPALLPQRLRHALDQDEYRLYELIWKRTIASQMQSAEIERTTIDLASRSGDVVLRASGSVITFDGFLALYQEGRDDKGEETGETRLPRLSEGEEVRLVEVGPTQHFTEPPPRYSEASLVKKLEELGIGRPSTYASILSVLVERNYVRLEKKRFIPEDKGRLVTAFLENFFARYVEYDFTAKLEAQLDDISAGKANWKEVLRDFWNEFEKRTKEVLAIRNSEVLETLNEFLGPAIFRPTPENPDPRRCPSCGEGRLSLKTGRFGAFIGCSNYPECRYTRQFTNGGEDADAVAEGPRLLGTDPESGEPITLRSGKYGPYLQRGENGDGGNDKPARASLPRDISPDEVDLELALKLLSLPREIGTHPETGKPVLAGIGRYGPYVQHERVYASLKSSEEVFSVGMNRALALLADKAKGAGGELRALGTHPETGKPIRLMKGRYGPYVKHDGVNATLPKDMKPEEVTLETALELLAAKGAKKGRAKGTRKRTGGRAKAGAAAK